MQKNHITLNPNSQISSMSNNPSDASASFEHFYKQFKNIKNPNSNFGIKKHSDNYYCLLALWRGERINDYSNPPLNKFNRPMRNVPSRISDLKNKYGVEGIKTQRLEDKTVEYWLER